MGAGDVIILRVVNNNLISPAPQVPPLAIMCEQSALIGIMYPLVYEKNVNVVF